MSIERLRAGELTRAPGESAPSSPAAGEPYPFDSEKVRTGLEDLSETSRGALASEHGALIKSGVADGFKALSEQHAAPVVAHFILFASQVGLIAPPMRSKPGTVALSDVEGETRRLTDSMRALTDALKQPDSVEAVLTGRGPSELAGQLAALSIELETLQTRVGGVDPEHIANRGLAFKQQLKDLHTTGDGLRDAAEMRFPPRAIRGKNSPEANCFRLASLCAGQVACIQLDVLKQLLARHDARAAEASEHGESWLPA